MVAEGVRDVPALLAKYEGQDIPSAYAAKIAAAAEAKKAAATKGIGGLVRSRAAAPKQRGT